MKLTNRQLKQIIKEELNKIIIEQGGVDFQGMLSSKNDDEDLYQRMMLAADSGMLDFDQEDVEEFLDGYRQSMDIMDSIGGIQNKNKWSDADATVAHKTGEDLQMYRTISTKVLKKAGLLKQ